MENSLINFIKDALLVLSCSTKLDHRNYERGSKKQSRLQKLGKTHSLDESIRIIVNDVINNKILQLDVDEDEDKNNNVLFTIFIEYVGLYEIFNLHSDDEDKFRERFIEIITNN